MHTGGHSTVSWEWQDVALESAGSVEEVGPMGVVEMSSTCGEDKNRRANVKSYRTRTFVITKLRDLVGCERTS